MNEKGFGVGGHILSFFLVTEMSLRFLSGVGFFFLHRRLVCTRWVFVVFSVLTAYIKPTILYIR